MIDFFVHPAFRADEGGLHDLSGLDWDRWFGETLREMDRLGIERSGVCLMDPALFEQSTAVDLLRRAGESGRFFFTWMPDFRRLSPETVLSRLQEGGISGITFHSYLQRIVPADYGQVAEWSAAAASSRMLCGFCTAYGSKGIFEHFSLPLVVEVAKRTEGPIVLYHAGGAKILEAMLICEMWPNLYLETSFSLSYWRGSSVETDLAFAIRKLGADRVLFGSDAPFVPAAVAIADHRAFFEERGFGEAERASIMGGSAARLLDALKS